MRSTTPSTSSRRWPDPPDVIVASIHEGAPDGTQTLDAERRAQRGLQEDRRADRSGRRRDLHGPHAPGLRVRRADPGRAAARPGPLIQTGNYGGNVGQIKLTVDGETGDVTSYVQKNVARTTTADSTLTQSSRASPPSRPIVDAALAYAATIGNQPIGSVTADITTAFTGTTRDDRASESTLGNLVGRLAAVQGQGHRRPAPTSASSTPAVCAPTCSTRATRRQPANTDGVITYAEANSVLPFVNTSARVTLTGASLKKVLEQQWQRDADGNVPTRAYLQLGLSEERHYTFDADAPRGRPHHLGDDQRRAARPGQELQGRDVLVPRPRAVTTSGRSPRARPSTRAWSTTRRGSTTCRPTSPVSPDFARRSVRSRASRAEYAAGELRLGRRCRSST